MSDSPGIVYVLVNQAWPDWVKIGHVLGSGAHSERALDRRLSNYNVGDPHNGYCFAFLSTTSCAVMAEDLAHKLISTHHTRGTGEWFKCHPNVARALVDAASQIGRFSPEARGPRAQAALTEERERIRIPSKVPVEVSPLEVADVARAAAQIIEALVEEWQIARDYTSTDEDVKLELASSAVLRRLEVLGGEA